jgi:hypothetical protein
MAEQLTKGACPLLACKAHRTLTTAIVAKGCPLLAKVPWRLAGSHLTAGWRPREGWLVTTVEGARTLLRAPRSCASEVGRGLRTARVSMPRERTTCACRLTFCHHQRDGLAIVTNTRLLWQALTSEA